MFGIAVSDEFSLVVNGYWPGKLIELSAKNRTPTLNNRVPLRYVRGPTA